MNERVDRIRVTSAWMPSAVCIGWVAAHFCGGYITMNAAPLKLAVARSHHCTTVLNDGALLITGGNAHDERAIDAAEIVSVTTGANILLAGRHLPRTDHSCVKLLDGRVLLIGGMGADRKPEARIEAFDPATRTFSEIAKLATARVHHQAVRLSNNQVLVVGGRDSNGRALNTAELIDSTAGTVTGVGAMMGLHRYHHQARLLEDGLVLITGGAGDPKSPRTAELYDPAKNLFLTVLDMNVERVIHTAVLLGDGRVFTFSNGQGELFQPSTRRFEAVQGIAKPAIRDGHTATLLKNGRVLIVGGGVPDFGEDLLGAPLLYDSRNGYSAIKEDALVNRADHSAVRLDDDRVFFCGGRTLDALATDAVFLYDPIKNEFTQ